MILQHRNKMYPSEFSASEFLAHTVLWWVGKKLYSQNLNVSALFIFLICLDGYIHMWFITTINELNHLKIYLDIYSVHWECAFPVCGAKLIWSFIQIPVFPLWNVLWLCIVWLNNLCSCVDVILKSHLCLIKSHAI